MKRMLMAVVVLALAGGCVSKEQVAAQQAELSGRRERAQEVLKKIDEAEEKAVVRCAGKASCDKAFSLAKVYVSENADMRVQISDDTMISTFGPIKTGRLGMRAVKVPDTGDSAKVELTVDCQGLDAIGKSLADPYYQVFELCSKLMVLHYEGFKEFIDARMK